MRGSHVTSDGPAPIDHTPVSEPPAEPATTRVVAWDTYDTHRRNCPQCQTSVWRCETGDGLWDRYLKATA
jgi:hypothetical protein